MNTNSQNENGKGKGIEQSSCAVSVHSNPENSSLLNKKAVKYMQCLKNHAAAIGGHATDGCGEFMSGGEEGTIEALVCSACSCHRNFHKKVIEEECSSQCYRTFLPENADKHLATQHHHTTYQVKVSPPKVQLQTSESDEHEKEVDLDAETRPREVGRKRHRTKFSQQQKEKMWSFAEKIGWKIQKVDDSAVNHFCQEIGIRRRILMVWMHNNKHNSAKKCSFLS